MHASIINILLSAWITLAPLQGIGGAGGVGGAGGFGNQAAASSTITFDAASISASIGSGTTVAWNHTVGVSSHPVLVVALLGSAIAGAATATCTFNSVSMTLLASPHDGTNANAIALFILVAPSVGTFSISCVWGASIGGLVGQAESYFGVNQSTPNRTPIINTPASGTNSPTYLLVNNAVSGDMVVDAVTVNLNGTMAVTAGAQTQRNERNNVSGNNFSAGSSSAPAAGSTIMAWTFSGGLPRAWAAVGMALIPG